MRTPDFGEMSGKAFADVSVQVKLLGNYQEKLVSAFNLSGIAALSETYSNYARQLEANAHAFTSMLQQFDFKSLLDNMLRQTPYNYDGLMISEQFELIDASRKYNFGTVEVLPADLVESLLKDSSVESINDLLLDSIPAITNKASELVDAYLDEPELVEYAFLLGRAIEAMTDGHYEASQTLSTALWDSYLCERAGRKDALTAVKTVGSRPDIESMENFSPLYDYGAYGPAIAAYTTPGESGKYSRNGTIHHLSKTSANKLNSIKSLTIATGVLGRAWRQLPATNNQLKES